MATAELLISANEFAKLGEKYGDCELVQGRIVKMNRPAPRHGLICSNVDFALRSFLLTNDLGRVVINDSGVVTGHNPDSVRGPDVAFFSYERVPKRTWPDGYLSVVPEICFEVLSPDDRWREVLIKVTEFLQAGVTYVAILDPRKSRAIRYDSDNPEVTFAHNENLSFPEVLPGLILPVAKLFE